MAIISSRRTPQQQHLIDRFHQITLWLEQHLLLLALALLLCSIMYLTARRATTRHKTKVRRAKLTKSAPARSFAEKVAPLVGQDASSATFVKWPRNPQAAGALIEIRTDRHWSKSAKLPEIPPIITSIAGGEWVLDRHDGLHNRVYFRRRPELGTLPELYEYDGARHPMHQVPFAINEHGQPIIGDLRTESPHALLAGRSGGGKTSTLNVFIAHVTSHGGLVDVIDPKFIGFVDTFEGLGNVRVAVELGEMIEMIESFHDDMVERYRMRRTGQLITDPARFPTRLLVIDEMGDFTSRIRQDWADQRDRSDPATSSTERLLQKILWQGRAADMHLIVAAQQANANVIGSTDKREQFGLRICCGAPGKRGGPLLLGTDDYPRIEPKIKGRGLVVLEGGDVQAVQLAYISDRDARAHATRGGLSFTEFEVLRGVNNDVNNSVNVNSDPNDSGCSQPFTGVDDASRDSSVNTSESADAAGAIVMDCGGCGAEISTRSNSVARCSECGRRQRIPAAHLRSEKQQ